MDYNTGDNTQAMSEQIVNITINRSVQEFTISVEPPAAKIFEITASRGNEPLFLAWKTLMYLEGEKRTGVDAGELHAESVTDDYLYKCIKGGEAGVAVWKKILLFQSL